MYSISVYFWMILRFSNNHDKNSIGINHKPARWGCRWKGRCWPGDVDFFCFCLKGSTLRKIHSYYHISHKHPMNIAGEFLPCSRCPTKIKNLSIGQVQWYRNVYILKCVARKWSFSMTLWLNLHIFDAVIYLRTYTLPLNMLKLYSRVKCLDSILHLKL